VTPDQVVLAAIGVVVIIFVIVGIARGATRRRGPNEDEFGAGGVSRVAIGTLGDAKTDIDPSGVVLAAGEQWTASSASGTRIAAGQRIRVVGQDGLTLLVDAASGSPAASASSAASSSPTST
jgi:membrane-bound serine protease (ClpP class)